MNLCAVCEFGYKVRPRNFGCIAMGSSVLFILRSILLIYHVGSGVNTVPVVILFW